VKNLIFFAEASFTQLVGTAVFAAEGERVGRVKDIAVRLGEVFPAVTKLLVRAKARKEPLVVAWELVRSFSAEAVHLHLKASELNAGKLEDREVLLGKTLLDRQIVDVQGRRLVRVNDLKLGSVAGQVRLVAAAVGSRGLLRRLGIEGIALRLSSWFGRRPLEQLISWELVHSLHAPAQQLQLALERERLAKLRPADLADIISQLNEQDRHSLFHHLDDETAADALQEMEPELQVSVMESLDTEKASDILDEMVPDDAADLVADLSRERADELLDSMGPDEASDVKELLAYPEDSAGGLMTTDYVGIPAHLTVDQAIAHLRQAGEEPETIYYIYVVDEEEHLTGVLSLRDLIVSAPERPLAELMERNVVSVGLLADQREIAHLMTKYNLLALPVVDDQQRLQGIVTVDDAIDAVIPTRWKKRIPKAF
jgi:CBS domain-containing protein/sporulation protein YlmC with PRC-barrel domain